MKTQDKHKQNAFSQMVEAKEKRILKEKHKPKRSILFGLGLLGVVGWSVVVPALLGTLFGIWLDKRFPGKQSWTLTLLFIGLMMGCVAAWRWLSREDKAIHKDEEDKNE